ncbi:protein containing Nucleotide binding protein, PINc domain [sediment metagenome]|uniref:Protein containing Nucleotide binding protein, PINc domain n=1 Tax=sediment metagenome TaxID=749907 RepID=D9PJC5_9ZZZZ
MNLVIDANILFSLLIKEGKTIELLLDLSINLFTPEFIFTEFEKHKQEILKKTNRSEEEFDEILNILEEIITIVPSEEFKDFQEIAKGISPDPDDIMYFALALKLNCPIWTNDKKLKQQDKVKIYSTSDLAELA